MALPARQEPPAPQLVDADHLQDWENMARIPGKQGELPNRWRDQHPYEVIDFPWRRLSAQPVALRRLRRSIDGTGLELQAFGD